MRRLIAAILLLGCVSVASADVAFRYTDGGSSSNSQNLFGLVKSNSCYEIATELANQWEHVNTTYDPNTGIAFATTYVHRKACSGGLREVVVGDVVTLTLFDLPSWSFFPRTLTITQVTEDTPSLASRVYTFPLQEVAVFCTALLSFFLGFRTGMS